MIDPKLTRARGLKHLGTPADAVSKSPASVALQSPLGQFGQLGQLLSNVHAFGSSMLERIRKAPAPVALGLVMGLLPLAPAAAIAGTHPAHPVGIELRVEAEARLVDEHRDALRLIAAKREVLRDRQAALDEAKFEVRSVETTMKERAKIADEKEALARYGPLDRLEARLKKAQAELEGPKAAVDAAAAELDEALAVLQPIIEQTKADLDMMGLGASARRSVDRPDALLGILDFARAWQEATGLSVSDLTRAQKAWLVVNADHGLESVQRMISEVERLPRAYLLRPETLGPLRDGVSESVLARAKILADTHDVPITPLDFAALEALDEAGFERLESFLTQLAQKAGYTPTDQLFSGWTTQSDLSVIAPLSVVMEEGGRASVYVFPPSAMHSRRVDLDRDALFSGIEEARALNIPFDGTTIEVVALLGSGRPEHQAFLREILERCELTHHPAEGELLAELAVGGATSLAQHLPHADAVAAALGRKLSFSELRGVLLGAAAGTKVEQLVDGEALASATSFGEPVPIKDLTTWKNLSPEARGVSRADLVESIGARLVPGSARTDRGAEYPESFLEQADRLTMGELHKIALLLDLLERPSTRAQLEDIIARDLGNDSSELGGWLPFDASGRLFFEEQGSPAINNNSYAFPTSLDPHLAGANFHLHAVNHAGNPASSGPSSAYDGVVGDRGGAFGAHRDGVVISFLGGDRFNVDFYTAGGAVVDLGDYGFTR